MKTFTKTIKQKTPQPLVMAEGFKPLLDQTYVKYESGIINSVLLKDDKVYATIFRAEDEHDGVLFNADPSQNPSSLTFQEIFIPTDIIPMGGVVLDRFKGRHVTVTIKNDIAIYATLMATMDNDFSTISGETVRNVRKRLTKKTGTDLFSVSAQPIWDMFGVAREKVLELQKMIYDPEKHQDKVITIEGEGNWGKDVSAPREGEVQIERNNLIAGTNGLGMKDNLCHMPTTIFSAK